MGCSCSSVKFEQYRTLALCSLFFSTSPIRAENIAKPSTTEIASKAFQSSVSILVKSNSGYFAENVPKIVGTHSVII